MLLLPSPPLSKIFATIFYQFVFFIVKYFILKIRIM